MLLCMPGKQVVFVTYGDHKFRESRERIIREAERVGVFTRCIKETEEILQDEGMLRALESSDFKDVMFNESNRKDRGGGSYIWKPYVIYKNLSLLKDGDILVYADAGCTIPKDAANELSRYFEALEAPQGVLGLRSKHLESETGKADVMAYFGVLEDPNIYNTPKFACTKHFVRKCDHSMKLYSRWWEVAQSNPHLFDTSPSKVPNYPNFVRHVYDTTTWSIICKTMGVVDFSWTEEESPIKVTRIRR